MIRPTMPLSLSNVRHSAVRWMLAAFFAVSAPARADIDVQLEGIEGELRNNVEIFLSVERYKKRDDIDEDTMQRLFDRIDNEVRRALRPLGYYQPRVDSSFGRRNNDWVVRIHVTPGEPVRLRELSIRIEGPGADDPAFDGIRTQTDLREGMRLHHGSYEKVKGAMVRMAAANGYLAARLVDSEMLVDPEARVAGIKLTLDTGPRYYFGQVHIDQNVIRPSLMQRFVRFREGDPYSANELLRTQFALDDSLYFSRVDVSPGDPDPETLTVPVTISVAKSRPTLTLGGGYGTDTKVRGTLGWTDSRVNDKGHRLRFELEASENRRTIDSRYDIPIGDPALEKFSLELFNEYEEVPDNDTNETTLRPSITRVHNRWQTVTSLSATRTTQRGAAGDFATNLFVPGFVLASVPEGFLGEALFSRGFYAELIGSTRMLGSRTRFLRLDVQMERFIDLNYYWHLFLRSEIGTTWVDDFQELAFIYRFLAGGDRSVRGFAHQSLSPTITTVSDDGSVSVDKVGGKHLLTGTVELIRDLPRNISVAAFVDAGNAFNHWGDSLEYSAGLGLRYRLPVVSIGIDVAKPLSTNGKYRLHLNITPKL
jgi:translocation and assembly module TamA